jgi:tetratricopeptide (TPR) repeat protein
MYNIIFHNEQRRPATLPTTVTEMSAPTEDPAVSTDVEQKTESVSASSRSSSNNNVIACSTCKTPQTKTFVLKKCSCQAAQYCNTKCQKKHRKAHKEECRRLTAERKSKWKKNKETTTQQQGEGERKDNTDNVKTAAPKKEVGTKEYECPICLEVLPNDVTKFTRMTCCGNGIHVHCDKDLTSMKIGRSCPLCRAKTPTSQEEVVKYIRPWVKKKKAWAQYLMGQYYRNGTGVRQSYEVASILYEKAAQQGFAAAMTCLGVMYQNGRGVEQSYERAVEYYEQAADLGYAIAQVNLGNMYRDDLGVEQSYEKAFEHYEQAADLGDADAQYNLGRMYATGQGVLKNETTAHALWTLAAAQGDEMAIKMLPILEKNMKKS